MVTKLRRFSRSKITKFVFFTLTVLLLSTTMVQMLYISSQDLEALWEKDYIKSDAFLHKDLSPAIRDILNQMLNDLENIEPEPKYLYHISNEEKTYSNASLTEIKKNEKYYYNFKEQVWMDQLHENYDIHLAFPEDYIQLRQEEWNQIRGKLLPIMVSIVISIIVSIVCIIYLIAVTGRSPQDDEVHLTPYMDRIYSDLGLGIILLTLFIWISGESDIIMNYGNSQDNSVLSINQIIALTFSGLLTALTTIVCGMLFLSLVRKIKARKLLKHSLIYTILAGISNFIRRLFDDSRFEHFPLTKSLNRRQIIFTVVSGSLVFSTVFFIQIGFILVLIPLILEMVVIYWYFIENKKTFDEINQGFDASLQEQMKSERMKVDLITNVSHDLKTPLTSIISYVDLLSKEELPDTARDYVNILADKSERLKNIVSDLFDLAKSTSGNLPLDMEELDLKKLIEQTLADMEDDIVKSNIHIRTKLSDMPIYIYSDGNKLYRVFQNIIGNALKYSLEGTRVFIDMVEENNVVTVTVKNTASYEMEFTAEEILQRFNRGDKSRTTEGSGLGLSIAESYTWACGGRFKLEIDGDQFKVKLSFSVTKVVK